MKQFLLLLYKYSVRYTSRKHCVITRSVIFYLTFFCLCSVPSIYILSSYIAAVIFTYLYSFHLYLLSILIGILCSFTCAQRYFITGVIV